MPCVQVRALEQAEAEASKRLVKATSALQRCNESIAADAADAESQMAAAAEAEASRPTAVAEHEAAAVAAADAEQSYAAAAAKAKELREEFEAELGMGAGATGEGAKNLQVWSEDMALARWPSYACTSTSYFFARRSAVTSHLRRGN